MKNLIDVFKLSVLLVFIFISTFSCKEKSRSDSSGQKVDDNAFFTIPFAEIKKDQREVKLSEFASDVEFIQLENSTKALISHVNGLEISRDYIFIESLRQYFVK